MGTRVIRKNSRKPGGPAESRTLAMILGAVALPVLLACILVGMDMRSDLSELKPVTILGWPDLAHWSSQSPVKMLGYMMDGYQPAREGAQVSMFILMPEAGHLLHPAHREADGMVEVWLTRPVPFKFRSLVWVSGVLERRPAYAMTNAAIEPATETDIARWFTP